MFESNATRVIKFVSLSRNDMEPYAILGKDGKTMHVIDAGLIRLLAKGLQATYEVLMPADNSYGTRQPDGSWSGMIGMVKRSEADLAMAGVAITSERIQAVNFSYPHFQVDTIFMTDKPHPQSMKSAILKPFSLEIWVLLLVVSIMVAFLFNVLTKRGRFQNVALDVLASLLQQSMNFEIRSPSVTWLAVCWLLGTFVVTNCYKAVLLSFMSVPFMTGIRDIPELYRASLGDSFKCFTFRGSYLTKSFMESDDESIKAIGECLGRTEIAVGSTSETFYNTPSEKAFVGAKHYLTRYERHYFLSGDVFYQGLLGLPVSKDFCCKRELNRLIHRLVAAGLVDKIIRDENFYEKLVMPTPLSSHAEDHSFRNLSLDDVSGSFLALMAGWLLAGVVFLAEIVIGNHLPKRQ